MNGEYPNKGKLNRKNGSPPHNAYILNRKINNKA